MPVHSRGHGCYQWGHHGKVYCGPGARAKAERQGRAAYAGGYRGQEYNLAQVPGSDPTPRQRDWARDLKATGFVLLPAETFLRLTLPVFERDWPEVERESHPVASYQQWADQAPPPFLKIERSDAKRYAKVIGHEGRHRAAALLRERGPEADMWVAIILAKDGYAIPPYREPVRIADTPREALSEFRASDYGGVGGRKLVPLAWTDVIDLYEQELREDAQQNEIDRALAVLDAQPPAFRGATTEVRTIIPYDPSIPFQRRANPSQYPIRAIPVAELITDQKDVRRDVVRYYIEHGWTEPIVVRSYRGRWLIQDGNHRAFAAILLGLGSIQAHVVPGRSRSR